MDGRIKHLAVRPALCAIADLVMPRVCVVCGRPLIPAEKDICLACMADFPFTRFASRSHNPMADKFNALVEDNRYCYAAALYHYSEDAGYKHISQALKYHRNFAVGKHFGKMLGEDLASSGLFKDVDAVIPVPLHWTRQWKRGYNQAEVIAEAVAEVLGCPVVKGALKRTRRTSTQTRLSGAEKTENVAGAFACKPVEAGHILLIDDVFTSGSTFAACHRAVRDACPEGTRISAASLAFVEG